MKRLPGAQRRNRGARLIAGSLLCALLLSACETSTTVVTTSDTAKSSGGGTEAADPHRRAQVRLELAAGYYQKGQPEVALSEAQEAVQLDSENASGYGLLGLIYMDLDRRDEADQAFRQALRLDPDNGDLNNNYGWYLCRNHREREALTYFDHAASSRLYTTPAMALQNAGICLMQIGDNGHAEPYLKRALQADASSPVAKFQLARLYLRTHRLDRADFYYQLLAKSLSDPNAQTLWLGARIAHAKSDRAAQRRLGDELLSRYPNSPEANLLNREAFDE